MELNKFKFPKMSNNYLIWILVAFIVLGFGNSSKALGFNFFNFPNNKPGGSHKHYPGGKGSVVPVAKGAVFPVGAPGGVGGFLSGNGMFILAIVALLFLCKDDKKKDSRGKREAEYSEED
jgi:hypothetical protein